MKREEIVQILRELKQLAGRVATSGPFDAHVYLGRFLDYIDNCPILKEYVCHCKLEIPERICRRVWTRAVILEQFQ